MERKEILEVPSAPQLTGIAGEVEALMHILGNKDITLPLPFLLGVSGVLFRFFVPTDFGLVNKGSSTLYFELTDGPDPVRAGAGLIRCHGPGATRRQTRETRELFFACSPHEVCVGGYRW